MSRETITTLKPCPFCGSKGELQSSWMTGQHFVFCSKSRCVMGNNKLGPWKKNKEKTAIKRWNTRYAK